MAKTKIGKIPVYKGEYNNNTRYDRLNQVTYLGTTFLSIVDDNLGHPPAEKSEDGGEILYINTNYWDIVAKGIDNVEERTATNNSMGYKILKKNKSFIEQVTEENTIYEIRYNFTLTENITIPANCILEFDGGSINGENIITFNNTILSGNIQLFSPFKGGVRNNTLFSSWFGIKNDSTTDNYVQAQNLLNVASNKRIIFDSVDSGYFKFKQPLVVYQGTNIDGKNNTFIFDFSTLMQDAEYRIGVGFMLSSNCVIENINGYCYYSGTAQHHNSQIPSLIQVGIFYGVSSGYRTTTHYYIPGIENTTPWDAPEDIIINNVKSDISDKSYDNHYNQAVVFMTNYVKNITVTNVSAIGFAEFIDISTSHTSTGKGICNDRNIMNTVRFEWGNMGNGNAAGTNIKVSNIYGKALCLHDHSAVVSMGNAYNFIVENVIGESTGQVVYCGPSIPEDATLTKEFTTINRIIRNVIGRDLYIYTYLQSNIPCGAIAIEGNYEYNKFNTSTIIENIYVKGNSIALNGFRLGYYNYPSSHLSNVIIRNAIIDSFDRGINMDIVDNIKIERIEIKNTKNNGIYINPSESSFIPSNIVIEDINFTNCCTEKRASSYDAFLSATSVDTLLINRCYFKQTIDNNMFGTYFTDKTSTPCKRIKVKDCIFDTPDNVDHIAYSTSINNTKSIRIIDCTKTNGDAAQIGNSWLNPYVSSIWNN